MAVDVRASLKLKPRKPPRLRTEAVEPAKAAATYAIFRGNGNAYLREAFDRRPQWRSAETTLPAASSPSRHGSSSERSRAMSPPPRHGSSSDKGVAMWSGADTSKQQENLALSKALVEGGVSFVFRDLLCGPHWVAGVQDQPGNPSNESLFCPSYVATDEYGQPQTVNRWPAHASLTTKDGSLLALVRYYRDQGLSPWAFMPLSFYVPNLKLTRVEPANCPQWCAVRAAHALVGSGADPRVPSEQRRVNMWLLKPTNGSGGEGIAIGSDIEELEHVLSSARASTQGFIAQKYLEAPLLYDGRKFDLRVWAVCESDPGSQAGLRVYAYREGYARTSSEAFSLPASAATPSAAAFAGVGKSADDCPATEAALAKARLVHLTNYCMQVKSDKCGQHEEGNAISFGDLDAHAGPSLGFRKAVLPMIYAQIADAVLAARKELLGSLRQQGRGRRVCALLGYDFMVSASGVPCLIECNANPLLAAQSPWHGMLVKRMVDDYVSLAADGPLAASGVGGNCGPPLPRPPLDGVHCPEFEGSGFLLLVGRPPTASLPSPSTSSSTTMPSKSLPKPSPLPPPPAAPLASAAAEAVAAETAAETAGETAVETAAEAAAAAASVEDALVPPPPAAAPPAVDSADCTAGTASLRPMFGLRVTNGFLALERSAAELEAAKALPEPELPAELLQEAPPAPDLRNRPATPQSPEPTSRSISLRGIHAVQHEATVCAAAAQVRRIAAMRFAAAHRAKARTFCKV